MTEASRDARARPEGSPAPRAGAYEVEGKRLGIVGLGNIGKKVARHALGFDMDIRYYDILRLTEDQEDALGVRFALFTELLRTSDVVTLHVPLNDVTRKMMSTREFDNIQRMEAERAPFWVVPELRS